ncbi:MAG: CPBP family intramembrane metalloprotease [Prolixibacteraceae bacterium]|nr:CPBP family intramembrane metalloprotease [Prolixibacteraceae bacterium]MBN2774616.1 CPBP family intramembrane metalloprotease [Prolixibacteraceae bacterium]
MKNKSKTYYLGIEFTILFFGVPIFLLFEKSIVHPTSILLPILIALIIYFRKQKDFKTKDLFRLGISKKIWLKQVFVLIASGIFLVVYVLLFEPDSLFNLPRQNPVIWGIMLIFYPVFSAYGQEIIYRKFLFKRYNPLFQKKWLLILASGVTFSFVHILFFSTLSLVLTFIAGIYLAWIYEKTQSVMFTAILHGIVGFLIFTVGLGQHFWLDMMEWL